tara:strand:- start:113130 stop:113921 length:792 start_codon:yes stop_codon:yes gene_type:complete
MPKKKVLITVKTYPHPSKGYQELVCTAGVSESGEWIRLYPVDYRYRPKEQQFEKYQWIEVDLEKSDPGKDNRPESFRPDLESIRVLGERMNTDDNWRERREIIDKLPHRTLNEWKAEHDKDKTSLGIVKPSRIIDMEIREVKDPEWKSEWKALFSQMRLFGPAQKPLTKLPYSFHYIFECEDDDKPHTAMCEDWELGTLFLKEVDRLGSEGAAADSVKKKYFDQMCSEKKDTRFFMGTRFPYNVWLVLGVFWPPKIMQRELFS